MVWAISINQKFIKKLEPTDAATLTSECDWKIETNRH